MEFFNFFDCFSICVGSPLRPTPGVAKEPRGNYSCRRRKTNHLKKKEQAAWSVVNLKLDSETKGFNLSKDMSAAFREEGPHEERSSQTPASHSSCQL